LAGLQITCAVVLLIVAAFMRHDLGGRLARGPGFEHHGRLLAWFDPDMVGTRADQAQRFYEALSREARDLPGARAATLTSFVPMDGGELRIPFRPEGVAQGAAEAGSQTWSAAVDESYFDALGIRLLDGRSFTASDDRGTALVALVNTTVADKYWPGQTALGKRFRAGDDAGPWVEVVGVAPTTPSFFLIERPSEFVYFPRRQSPRRSMALVVQADAPEAVAAPLRALVQRLDGRQPILRLRPLSEQYQMRAAVVLEILMTLVTGTAVMGIGLALVGLYGLVAYGVARRTKEVGVRVAIGARTIDILRLVLRQGLTVVGVGLVLGVPSGLAASRVIAAALPGGAGLTPAAAAPFAVLILSVAAVAFLAAYVPARRALRIAPTEALRCE
jgi:predicted permease